MNQIDQLLEWFKESQKKNAEIRQKFASVKVPMEEAMALIRQVNAGIPTANTAPLRLALVKLYRAAHAIMAALDFESARVYLAVHSDSMQKLRQALAWMQEMKDQLEKDAAAAETATAQATPPSV